MPSFWSTTRAAGVALTLIAWSSAASSAAAAPLREAPRRLSTLCTSASPSLDGAAQSFFDSADSSALQIAVWKHGQFVYSQGFGTGDPQHARPVTREALFQIGSNTKKATALAVLRAVDAGLLQLDDRVEQVLPQLKLARDPHWTQLATVRDLLSHQSGLWDYTPWLEAPEDADLTATLYGSFAEHEWSTTPPGAVYNYSNANYGLLGAILERAYDAPYRTIMEQQVYAPLGLHHTYARREEAVATGRAVWGYGPTAKTLDDLGYDPFKIYPAPSDAKLEWIAAQDQQDNAFARPAGFTWSTAEDECRVGAFLVTAHPELLSERSRHELLTPQAPFGPEAPELAYSFGLMLGHSVRLGADAEYDLSVWTHTGGTLTMASNFMVFPEQQLVMSLLTNSTLGTDKAQLAWQQLLVDLILQYLELPTPHAPAAPEPPGDASRYAGTYSDPNGLGSITLTWDGTQLSIVAPELEALGAKVDPQVGIAQKDLLTLTVDGTPVVLSVWPSATDPVAYLVSREDAFTRVTSP